VTWKPINTCLNCATAAGAAAAAADVHVDAASLAGDADYTSADTPTQRQSVAVVVYGDTPLAALYTCRCYLATGSCSCTLYRYDTQPCLLFPERRLQRTH